MQDNPKSDEYTDIFDELNEKQPELCKLLVEGCKDIESIRKTSGELNLAYESNEAEAVKVCFLSAILVSQL